MRWAFAVRLAWREGRGAMKKTALHVTAVALGVGALVAVHGFRADAERSIHAEARTLMGADLRLWRRDPLPDSLRVVVDSLVASGARASTVVSVPTMVLSERTETARLFRLRSVAGGWPFYGEPTVRPAGRWPPRGEGAWVDPAVLVQLGADVGDTLVIGELRVEVVATVSDLPAEFGFQTAIGPQVLVSAGFLERAGLLGFGSLARYETFIASEDEEAPEEIGDRYETLLRGSGTGYTTARRRAENLSEGLDGLSRYLGIVGLAALLLGGIGVASAVHVFVRSKLTAVAVLRCLGATRSLVLAAYVLQAAAVGIVGSTLGAVGGVGLQAFLPRVLGDLLPLEIVPRVGWSAVALGLFVGVWTTVLFALGPLLPLRRVPPLRALRRGFEADPSDRDVPLFVTRLVLAGTVVGLAALEAPSLAQGMAVSAGLTGVLAALWLLAVVTTRTMRRLLPSSGSFALRQGVSNLFRPRNQTVPVLLALGFGVFVVATVVEVERNIADTLSLEAGAGAPNVLLFDIQTDQLTAVEELVAGFATEPPSSTPLVPSRIAALDGRPAAELMADSTPGAPERWALRREYRNTYRAELTATEELVAGEWWETDAPGLPRISLEADLAESLGVGVGSRITWTLAGRRIETVVTSLRVVDWARFEPNFFVVFEPGPLEEAPHTWLTLAHVESDDRRARLQRDVAVGFSNVSVLDLARVQEALNTLLGTMRRAIGLLALFSGLAGVAILGGSVAVTRSERIREAALLKTLGARRDLLLRILLTEYVALGGLAALGAVLLAAVASWALVTLALEMSFRPHLLPAFVVAAGVTTLALAAGLAGSRGILGRPPLRVLRETSE